MRAAVLRKLGQSPAIEDFPEPIAAEGEALVSVLAAALKPIDKLLAAGTHFASPQQLPVVCGSDGVGKLNDGSRIFFGGPRRPYGSFAERTVIRRAQCFSVPESLDDLTAASIPNPGVSAWLSLSHRARLSSGETVLILGATGVTGTLAVQIAKILGASRVVAAGRNPNALARLPSLGADAVVSLDQPRESLVAAFRHHHAEARFDVILDYVWGPPVEAVLAAITVHELAASGPETRLVQVGDTAGPTIQLPAAALRSTALSIMGTAGIPPMEVLSAALSRVFEHAAKGELQILVEELPLARIAAAWNRPVSSRRLVFRP